MIKKNKFLEIIHDAKPDDRILLIKISADGKTTSRQNGFTGLELVGALEEYKHGIINQFAEKTCKCKCK